MRRVLLLRHAKSDWSAPYGMDRDRPLNARGTEAARLMGSFLQRVGMAPDAILTSPAVRARTTAELAAEAAGWRLPIEIRPGFYGGGGEAVLEGLRGLSGEMETALLVGHEPIWSATVGGLCGGADVRFPTAALACLTSHATDWESIGWGRMELRWLLTPKLLKRSGFVA